MNNLFPSQMTSPIRADRAPLARASGVNVYVREERERERDVDFCPYIFQFPPPFLPSLFSVVVLSVLHDPDRASPT